MLAVRARKRPPGPTVPVDDPSAGLRRTVSSCAPGSSSLEQPARPPDGPAVTNAKVGRSKGRGALRSGVGSGSDSSGTAFGGASDQLADAYLRHGAAVYGLVRNVAGTAAAEQVTVDVFLALARMPRDLSGGTRSLRSWLLALAHREAVHVLRSDPDRRSRLAAMAPRDVERATSDRIGARARNLLSGLSADQRRSIALAYFGGHDCREIAAILGQAEDTIKVHLQTGLRRLSTTVENGCVPQGGGI